MRSLVLFFAACAVSFSASASELSKVGEFFVEVAKGSVDLAKAFNAQLAENSLEVQYFNRTKSADDVWRLKWTAELQPVLPEHNAFIVKFVVRSDISEIDSINIEDALEQTILASAQVTLKEVLVPMFGVDLEYEIIQAKYSENDELLFDIGNSQHLDIVSVAAQEEIVSWENLSPLGFKVGTVTLYAGGKALSLIHI